MRTTSQPKGIHFGVQLYSLKEMCNTAEGLEETLKKVKEIGYSYVQFSGFEYDAVHIRSKADSIGLTISLTHTPVKTIILETAKVIETHKTLGADTVGVGGAGYYQFANLLGYKLFMYRLKHAVDLIQKAGLRFSYHNHIKEFENNGKVIDSVISGTDWDILVDLGWLFCSGCEYRDAIVKLTGRVKYAHIKDFSRGSVKGNNWSDYCVPLFEGCLPLDDLISMANDAGVSIAFVEMESESKGRSMLDQLATSYNALKARGWI